MKTDQMLLESEIQKGQIIFDTKPWTIQEIISQKIKKVNCQDAIANMCQTLEYSTRKNMG